MAIAKIRTKAPVVYDPITQASGVVYVDVEEIIVNSLGYSSRSSFYVMENELKRIIKTEKNSSTRAQSLAMYTLLGASGSNFDQQLYDLIQKVALYRLGHLGYFGLTANDWEIYV